MKKHPPEGFTLIEMLVVIAIIAVLAAVIIPTASTATKKANSAVDVYNLRSLMGLANTLLLDNNENAAATFAGMHPSDCKTYPGAEAWIGYVNPGFMLPAFLKDGKYYTLDYFADIAATGSSTQSTAQPSGYTWYRVGGEAEPEGD